MKATSQGRDMNCIVQTEQEAVQFMCLILYHAGLLKPYSQGSKPCVVELAGVGLQAKFHCWYNDTDNQSTSLFNIECFFIKRVSLGFSFSLCHILLKCQIFEISRITC